MAMTHFHFNQENLLIWKPYDADSIDFSVMLDMRGNNRIHVFDILQMFLD